MGELCNSVKDRVEEMHPKSPFGSTVRPKCAWQKHKEAQCTRRKHLVSHPTSRVGAVHKTLPGLVWKRFVED